MNRSTQMLGFGPSLSRRTVVRAGAASGSALLLGGLFGTMPGSNTARAQDDDGSPLYGDLGSAEEMIAAAEFYEGLDRVGSLDYSTGLVSVDEGALKDMLGAYLDGRRLESAYAAYLRHAELGFAVNGSPEDVARGRSTCLPWSVVEYLVGRGRDRLPIEYQYAILADLGVLEASSPEEVVEILAKRFPNVPPELSTIARALKRSLPAAQEFSWVTIIFEVIKVVQKDFVPPTPAKVKRDILTCIQTAALTTHWWGTRLCFDAECSETVAAYLRKGGDALSNPAVLAAVLKLGLPFWVAAIIAGGLLLYGATAIALSFALMDAINRSGGAGACIDCTWLLTFFGIPAVTATPNH